MNASGDRHDWKGDAIHAGTGNDTVRGGSGNDVIYAEGGKDNLSGGGGDDVFYLSGNANWATSDANNSSVYGGSGVDIVFGTNVDDIVVNYSSALDVGKGPFAGHTNVLYVENIQLGDGYDHYVSDKTTATFIDGGAGAADELMYNRTGVNAVDTKGKFAGTYVDFRSGTALGQHQYDGKVDKFVNFERAHLGMGDDRVLMSNANDWITTAEGNDMIIGMNYSQAQADNKANVPLVSLQSSIDHGISVDAGAGNDTVSFGLSRLGSANVLGGDGNDIIHVVGDKDETTHAHATVDGGAGNDWITANGTFSYGTNGLVNWSDANGIDSHNLTRLGESRDAVSRQYTQLDARGGEGNDVVIGSYFSDKIYGGNGDDNLNGGGDADYLQGDGGNDRLTGGWGSDWLVGGAGTDTFVFGQQDSKGADKDVIKDFNKGNSGTFNVGEGDRILVDVDARHDGSHEAYTHLTNGAGGLNSIIEVRSVADGHVLSSIDAGVTLHYVGGLVGNGQDGFFDQFMA